MITDSMFCFFEAFPKVCVSRHTCITQLIKKSCKKKLKGDRNLKKEGGGIPARYDHDHRFQWFFKASALWLFSCYCLANPGYCLANPGYSWLILTTLGKSWLFSG